MTLVCYGNGGKGLAEYAKNMLSYYTGDFVSCIQVDSIFYDCAMDCRCNALIYIKGLDSNVDYATCLKADAERSKVLFYRFVSSKWLEKDSTIDAALASIGARISDVLSEHFYAGLYGDDRLYSCVQSLKIWLPQQKSQ